MKTVVHRERAERIQSRELSKGIKNRKFRMLNLPRKRKSERGVLSGAHWPKHGQVLWIRELSPQNIMVKRSCGLMEITRNDHRICWLGALRIGLGLCLTTTFARPPCRHHRRRRRRRPHMPALLARGHGRLHREEVSGACQI